MTLVMFVKLDGIECQSFQVFNAIAKTKHDQAIKKAPWQIAKGLSKRLKESSLFFYHRPKATPTSTGM